MLCMRDLVSVPLAGSSAGESYFCKEQTSMNPSTFDDLTKTLATSTSRRQALKTIAATALGGILGLSGIGTAFAKCKPAGIGCNSNSQCCSGGCCHGTCRDLSNDPNNCGKCGNVCSTGVCQNGTCTSTCPPDLTCGDQCCPSDSPVCCVLDPDVGGTQCCPPPSSGCGCFGDIGDCLCG